MKNRLLKMKKLKQSEQDEMIIEEVEQYRDLLNTKVPNKLVKLGKMNQLEINAIEVPQGQQCRLWMTPCFRNQKIHSFLIHPWI